MKKLQKILLSIILVLGMIISPLQGSGAISAEAAEDNPMRALWLRPKETSKSQVEAAVEKIADAGINTIFLETVFNGFTIFPVEYDATYQNPMYNGFDVLQAYIDACHARGIQVHAWVESFFIGMAWESSGGPVYAAHQDWLLADKQGNKYEDTVYGPMYFLNPARPECRDWIVNLYAKFVENYDVDGIQLDYVRYPEKTSTKDYGFDEYTINAFIEAGGSDPTNAKEGSTVALDFVKFKQEQVTKYVKQCSDTLRAIKPELIISLSVYPFYNQGKSSYMQSAELWMNEGYGDLIVPMAYYEDQIDSITQSTIYLANGNEQNVVIGLLTQGDFTAASMKSQTDKVLDKGAGVAYFEYESFFGQYNGTNYSTTLKQGPLKDTEFNIDPKVYASYVGNDTTSSEPEITSGDLTYLNGNLYGTLGEINVLANGYAPATHWMSDQAEAFHGVNGMLLEFQPTTGKWVVTQSYVGQNIIAPNTVLQSGKIGYDEATGTITMAILFHTNAWSEYGESYYFFEKNNVLGNEFYMVGDFWTVVKNEDGSTKNDTAISGWSLTTVEPEDYFGKPGETPSEPGEGTTKGQLKIDALGGTGFIVEINGVKRPQGNSYTNSQIAIGTEVTVTAKEVSGAEFMGWVDVPINKIVSTDSTYSFFTSGNDQYKAMYKSSVSMDIDGVTHNAYLVMFQNDISNQILDMQYYFAGDEVVYPSDPVRPGYKFVEWSHSEEEIQAALENGEDITVTPVWEAVKTFVNVSVENGSVDSYTEMVDGKYLAISKMTVTADTPARGQKFAYWVEVDADGEEIIKSYSSSYTLYPSKDLALKAVYVDETTEIDYQVLVNMDAVKTTTTPTEIYLSWYVPVEENGYTFNSAGFIMVNKVNYNEDTFVLGSTDANVRKGQTNDASINAISYTTSRIAAGDTWMMRAFVQYQDENGVTHVKYSELIEVTKY